MKILFLYIFMFLFCSCNLDVNPENEISGNEIINTVEKANSVLSEAYAALSITPSEFTLLTEDLQPTYLVAFNPNERLYYDWNALSLEQTTANHWSRYYQALSHINAVLNSEPFINPKSAELNYVLGNAYVLKAFVYFELLQLFSERYSPESLGIVAKDFVVLENNKRLSQQESLFRIQSLLELGISLMSDEVYAKTFYINKLSAYTIQAQVALFKQDYVMAERIARNMITNSPPLPNTEQDYRNIWTNTISQKSKYIFWAYDLKLNPNAYLRDSDGLNGTRGDIFHLSDVFVFEKEDIRSAVSTYIFDMNNGKNEIVPHRLLGKYKANHTDLAERMYVLHRASEAHFILMESLIEQNKLIEAADVMNKFLNAVHAKPISKNETKPALRLIFRKEKQKEFIGERINFFDLKRWNIPIYRYKVGVISNAVKIQSDDFRWTWPIPMSELRYNTNVVQNRGWRNLK